MRIQWRSPIEEAENLESRFELVGAYLEGLGKEDSSEFEVLTAKLFDFKKQEEKKIKIKIGIKCFQLKL